MVARGSILGAGSDGTERSGTVSVSESGGFGFGFSFGFGFGFRFQFSDSATSSASTSSSSSSSSGCFDPGFSDMRGLRRLPPVHSASSLTACLRRGRCPARKACRRRWTTRPTGTTPEGLREPFRKLRDRRIDLAIADVGQLNRDDHRRRRLLARRDLAKMWSSARSWERAPYSIRSVSGEPGDLLAPSEP